MDIKQQTYQLIDDLKAVCHNYGMGNDGNEYKVITQIFLYKFLNDKFGYEIKKKSSKLASAEKWELAYAEMPEDDRLDLLDSLSADVMRLNPEHLISNLWNQQAKGDFDLIFDSTMVDIADKNIDIFSTQTTKNTKIPLFEKLTNYVTDDAQRAPFARALVDKLVNFSFEEAFSESYDFFAGIFEYVIKDYNTNGGGVYAEYYTPHAIAVIMARLLVGDNTNLHNIECYDPAAGTGTLLMALAHQVGEDKCTIFAQDRSQKSNKMLKLNLILNGLVSSLDHAVQGDTLTDPFHMSDDGQTLRQFDYIVCNPPFKLDFSETRESIAAMTARFWAGVPKVPATKKESMAIYTCFIQHVVNSLKDTGKAAIVLPTGFLTSKSSVEGTVLKHIVNNHIVYGVISMPANVFANTGTNVSVVFFDNSKKTDGAILIDATKLGEEYQEGNNKKVRLTNDEINQIADAFLNRKEIEKFSVIVPYDRLAENKCSLAPGQYFDVTVDIDLPTKSNFNASINKLSSKMHDICNELKTIQNRIHSIESEIHYKESIGVDFEEKILSDVADLVTISINPMNNKDTLYKHFSIPAFDFDKTPAFEYGSEIDSGKYLVPDGSILVSKLNPQFKRVWVPEQYDETSICSTEFMPFVPKDNMLRGFLFSIVNGPAFQQYMVQCSSSSTGSRKRMQPELCGLFSFVCPSDNAILEKYNELFECTLHMERLSIKLRKTVISYQDYLIPLIDEGYLQ